MCRPSQGHSGGSKTTSSMPEVHTLESNLIKDEGSINFQMLLKRPPQIFTVFRFDDDHSCCEFEENPACPCPGSGLPMSQSSRKLRLPLLPALVHRGTSMMQFFCDS